MLGRWGLRPSILPATWRFGDENRLCELLAARAGIDVFAAIAATIYAAIAAAVSATKNITGCRANNAANASTDKGPDCATAGCGCTNNGAAESAYGRTLLGSRAGGHRQCRAGDNQELVHGILRGKTDRALNARGVDWFLSGLKKS
jgi:hypothetical protein